MMKPTRSTLLYHYLLAPVLIFCFHFLSVCPISGQCCQTDQALMSIELMYLGNFCSEAGGRSDGRVCIDHQHHFGDRIFVRLNTGDLPGRENEMNRVFQANRGSTFTVRNIDLLQSRLPDHLGLRIYGDSNDLQLIQELSLPLSCQAGMILSSDWGCLRVQGLEWMDGSVCQAVSAGVLPLSYLSFEASTAPSGVNLEWELSQELFKGKVELQHSVDGHYFTVLSTFNADRKKYLFKDDQPEKQNFYRLKLFDEQGAFSFSPVKMVFYENNSAPLIYPNPVRSELMIEGLSTAPEFFLFDILGNLLLSEKRSTIDLSEFREGTYFIVIRDQGKNYLEKIIKR